MSSEAWKSDGTEDIQLKELARMRDNDSYSDSSAEIIASGERSITEIETSEDEAFYSAVSVLNSSDENSLAFDISRTSQSLESISTGALTRKASSLERFSIRKDQPQDHLKEPSTRRILSLDLLNKTSPRRVSYLCGLTTRKFSSLERPPIKRVSSHEEHSIRRVSSHEEPPIRRVSSHEPPIRRVSSYEEPSIKRLWTRRVSSLEGPSIRRVSSLEGPSIRRVSSLEGPPIRRVSSLVEPFIRRVSSLEGHSIRRVAPLEGPSTRRVAFLDPMEGPSTRRVVSQDPLEGSLTKQMESLDPQEGSSARRVTSLDPQEGSSERRVTSLNPVEGPSSRTVSLSVTAEGSLSNVFRSNLSETDEYFYDEPPIEQNGCFFRVLAWLKSFLRRQSRQIRHSVYYPLFLVVLITIPYSAGYMGCMYHYLCDGCPKLPHLMYFVGIFGTLILFLHLTAVLSKRYFTPHLNGQEFNTWMVSLGFPFFILLIIEMSTVYLCEPVFRPPHTEFCAKVFYNYAYYLNIAVSIAILLLMIINLPGYYDPSEAE